MRRFSAMRRLAQITTASLAMSSAHLAPARSQMPIGDHAAWQADFVQLKAALEISYVNLAWMGSAESGIDVPRLDRRTRSMLAEATTDAEAKQALLDFVAGFHDGHLSALAPVEDDHTPFGEPASAKLDPREPSTGCAALGFAVTGQVALTLPFESLPGFVLLGDGSADPFRSGLVPTPAGRRIGIVRIPEFSPKASPASCVRAWATLSASGKPLTADSVEEAATDAWFAAMAETLVQLRKRGATALLVDVGRNNGGGDSGDWIPRMFTNRPVSSAPLWMVDAPVSAQYFDEQIGAIDAVLETAPRAEAVAALNKARTLFATQKSQIGKTRCDMSWVWQEQRPWSAKGCTNLLSAGSASGASPNLPKGAFGNPVVARTLSWASAIERYFGTWTGPTYVLTDRRTFSSAEMFAATMRDNGIAKTIGTRTGGDGCGFMAQGEPLVLPHSRLRFRIPNCLRLRADGTDEVAGITPDYPVSPVQGESARARAARVLATIDKDIAAAR